MRLARLGRKFKGGWKHTSETKRKISEAHREEKCYLWKGNKVGYWGIHKWVQTYLPFKKQCEFCGTKMAKRYDRANKSHQYLRDLNDWFILCRKCHIKYDKESKDINRIECPKRKH